MRRFHFIMMAALAVLSLAASLASASGRESVPLPPLMLWAWDRGDDLRFIDPRHTGVAFLAATIQVEDGEVRVQRRRTPLRVPANTRLLAVAHFSVDRPTARALPQAAEAILELASLPRVAGVQLDFDATPSQRGFYRSLVERVRRNLPPGRAFSATALVSWCQFDRWMGGLPLDEVVPMAFSMGAGADEARAHLATGLATMPVYCRGSIGLSVQEAFPPLVGRRRIYAFNAHAWRADEYQGLLADLKMDHRP